MEFTFFEIENFRGIEKTRIELAKRPRARVVTLVGLNESGKTTVLEAINHFAPSPESLDPLEIPGQKIKDIHSLIPIAKRSNFNGKVRFQFGLELSPVDQQHIKTQAKALHQIDLAEIPSTLVITRDIAFANSKHNPEKSKASWQWAIQKIERVGKKNKTSAVTGDQWAQVVKLTRDRLPRIVYFPTFLFEFPEKIYLEATDQNNEKHEFYRRVLQDVLDTCIPNASLQTHVVDRIKSLDRSDKKNLDSVTLAMGRKVTEVVFGAWSKIFKQPLTGKSIRLEAEIEVATGKAVMQVTLEDADGYFAISERSLGFRWFFTFFLLTHFRGFRANDNTGVVFLFDEPASNLHATAQAQLLKSFEALQQRCTVIYTTHSHYMIDPRWLESTYVVRNLGLSTEIDNSYSANQTNIVAVRYRQFAAKHPDQTDYFKPILDVLDYQPSRLDNLPSVVMLEGKNDFYCLSLLAKCVNDTSTDLNWMPGTGSSGLSTPIQMYMAWGRPFLVVLDDDSEGRLQKQRYIEMFGAMLESRCFTLKDIDNSMEGAEIETLFEKTGDALTVQTLLYPSEIVFKKKTFDRAVQECLLTNVTPKISAELQSTYIQIANFCRASLKN